MRRRNRYQRYVRHYWRYGGEYSDVHETFKAAMEAAVLDHDSGEAFTAAITLEDGTMIACGPALMEFYCLWERDG